MPDDLMSHVATLKIKQMFPKKTYSKKKRNEKTHRTHRRLKESSVRVSRLYCR